MLGGLLLAGTFPKQRNQRKRLGRKTKEKNKKPMDQKQTNLETETKQYKNIQKLNQTIPNQNPIYCSLFSTTQTNPSTAPQLHASEMARLPFAPSRTRTRSMHSVGLFERRNPRERKRQLGKGRGSCGVGTAGRIFGFAIYLHKDNNLTRR